MIGQRAQSLRKQKRITLRELADQTGTSASTLSRFENGNLDIAYSTVLAVFEALGEPMESPGLVLTEAEANYIFLLTGLDALRLDRLGCEAEKEYLQRIRHGLRLKLLDRD